METAICLSLADTGKDEFEVSTCYFWFRRGKDLDCLVSQTKDQMLLCCLPGFFFLLLVGLLDTVPGTANPVNSQLQESHSRL